MARIGFIASEEMSFENVDDGRRTTDACLYYKLTYEPSAQVSCEQCQNAPDFAVIIGMLWSLYSPMNILNTSTVVY